MCGLFSIQISRSLDPGPIWARVISKNSREPSAVGLKLKRRDMCVCAFALPTQSGLLRCLRALEGEKRWVLSMVIQTTVTVVIQTTYILTPRV